MFLIIIIISFLLMGWLSSFIWTAGIMLIVEVPEISIFTFIIFWVLVHIVIYSIRCMLIGIDEGLKGEDKDLVRRVKWK